MPGSATAATGRVYFRQSDQSPAEIKLFAMSTNGTPAPHPVEDAIPYEQVQRALVIKLRQLGDVLLSTPVFAAMKRRHPQIQVDALIYRESLPLLQDNPDLGDIYCVDRKWRHLPLHRRVQNEIGLVRTLRNNHYDLVINLTEGDRGAFAAIISAARWRVGCREEKNAGFIGKPLVYTHLYRAPVMQRHIVEQQLDALRRTGLRIPMGSEPLVLKVPEASRRSALEKMRAAGWRGEPFVLFNPTSRCIYKCLPESTVARVMEQLHVDGHRIAIASGPAEAEQRMIRAIIDQCAAPVLDLGGSLDLLELGAALEQASAFLGSDSLPMHMAAALQVPTIAWFGPLPDTVWRPWMVPQQVVAMDLSCRPCNQEGCGDGMLAECLAGMEPESIVQAARELLHFLPQPKQ